MLMARLVIAGIAVLMVVVSVAILRKQAAARACPAHAKYAGIFATIIGWGLLCIGLVLAVFSLAFNY